MTTKAVEGLRPKVNPHINYDRSEANALLGQATAYMDAQAAEIERLTDLVRHQRHDLHSDGLISDEEYATLVADTEGGQRVARLEGYDQVRAGLRAVEAANASLVERVKEMDRLIRLHISQNMTPIRSPLFDALAPSGEEKN